MSNARESSSDHAMGPVANRQQLSYDERTPLRVDDWSLPGARSHEIAKSVSEASLVRSRSDRADLYDSPGDDTFRGTPDYAKLHGLGFYNKANNFEKAYAHATAGGADTARLEDPGYAYTMDRETNYTRLWDVGYYLKVWYFEELETDLGRERNDHKDEPRDDQGVWLADWSALRANFGNTGTGNTWTEGNFDPWNDDKVWLSDWAALRANFSNS